MRGYRCQPHSLLPTDPITPSPYAQRARAMHFVQTSLFSLQPLSCPTHGRDLFPTSGPRGGSETQPGRERHLPRGLIEPDLSILFDGGNCASRNQACQRLADRRLPGGVDVRHQITEEVCLSCRYQRYLTAAQAEKHHLHPWSGDKITRPKVMHDRRLEAWLEQHCRQG